MNSHKENSLFRSEPDDRICSAGPASACHWLPLLVAARRPARADSQCKKRGDNCQCPEQQECIGVSASSCLQYADKRWSGESSDVRNHGHESYSGSRCRPGQELSRHRPKWAITCAVSQWDERERNNRKHRLSKQGTPLKPRAVTKNGTAICIARSPVRSEW